MNLSSLISPWLNINCQITTKVLQYQNPKNFANAVNKDGAGDKQVQKKASKKEDANNKNVADDKQAKKRSKKWRMAGKVDFALCYFSHFHSWYSFFWDCLFMDL